MIRWAGGKDQENTRGGDAGDGALVCPLLCDGGGAVDRCVISPSASVSAVCLSPRESDYAGGPRGACVERSSSVMAVAPLALRDVAVRERERCLSLAALRATALAAPAEPVWRGARAPRAGAPRGSAAAAVNASTAPKGGSGTTGSSSGGRG